MVKMRLVLAGRAQREISGPPSQERERFRSFGAEGRMAESELGPRTRT